MSTPTTVKLDQSKNLRLVFRKGEGRAFTLQFLEDSANFDISPYTFLFQVFEIDGTTALFELTEGDGLTNGGAAGTLVIDPSDDDVDLDEKAYYWKLKVTAPAAAAMTWFNAQFAINNSPQEDTETDSATVNLDIGDIVIEVALTIGGTGEESTFASNPTLVLASGNTFGKYSNGETPAWIGLTARQAILDAIIDYIDPAFSAFSITGQAATVEVGTTLSGSKTFTWTLAENSGDVDTVDIFDNTAAATLLAGTLNDGSQAITITSIQLNANGSTQSWKAIANNLDPVGTIDSSNFVVTSRFFRFYGPAASSPADSAAVRALPSSAFHTGAGSFTLETGATETKFVVALPPGITIASVIDLDALNADITDEYVLTGTVSVIDAGGTGRLYNIYEMNIGVPYSESHSHQITTT